MNLWYCAKVRCADLEDFHVVVDGVTVFPDKKLKLLGVKFDSSFSTFPHGASVSASAIQRAAMIARLSHHLPRGAYLQQLARGLVLGKRAGLSSLNELTVHAVAMETWRAFHSQDGPDGSRNALRQVLFPSNVATRSTRSETAGVVSPHLPYAANTLACKRDQQAVTNVKFRSRLMPKLAVGDLVWIQDPQSKKWTRAGQVVGRPSERSYRVDIDGQVLIRNRKFLRPRKKSLFIPEMNSTLSIEKRAAKEEKEEIFVPLACMLEFHCGTPGNTAINQTGLENFGALLLQRLASHFQATVSIFSGTLAFTAICGA
eukprot:snap_masked-scaffold108_size357748-processed-gene-0.0 protein:Tk09439 transcript:snap_masked-scaffold108_size357748-processed-gene-0.0-mRNA-1 annotation:"hypothetical protein DAPPUDRAFT_105768"